MIIQHLKQAALLSTALFLTQPSLASDNASNASTHGSHAIKYSALAATDSLATTAAISTAIVAVPVMISGAVLLSGGAASVAIADNAFKSKKAQPLPISDDVIIAGPPPSNTL
ncbi:hypothetical protein [Pseudoalteromonas luteoviolacea]|uniref:Uncharacterized protein n=1 Tax=Pseudoalteromonas luteoviolacea S4054 TaxID=1129367 RepID=A0A0F6A8F6_9GAMM|nr:hypothetical protein [Pseudoalteromonas luteoviolacea]AOT11160.1 hypothetical protein S4054249_25360 [Pseudoalteromonas luteoviolacea]AOT15676.1 hypothetical protein S40542_23150 [Pseudoalteromonas luteoviolacea]AOT20981.1 hypothetical protein S4054_25280 [Pseudoalteromonas luteoviolacea]KKE82450.1 hypothetical protein N479_18425 [Pseudoalteromonas luteoviolacea S4054]KZN67408.1 hypothetical protein N481_02345 [Pseudoalteromonas luteoviolacea S4047-1]